MAGCWLFVASFCLSPEWILAFTVHSVTLCNNYLSLAVSKARVHSWQWQSTQFLSLYNQNYVKKALFVENNMLAGMDVRYAPSQLKTAQGWNVFSKVLKWGSCNAVVICTGWKTRIFSLQLAEKTQEHQWPRTSVLLRWGLCLGKVLLRHSTSWSEEQLTLDGALLSPVAG